MKNFIKYKSLILSFFMTGIISLTHAQNLKEDIIKIQEGYKTTNDIHMKITVRAFESANSKDPFFTQNAEIKKQGENYWTKNGEAELLINNKYMISVNHEMREIAYQPRKDKHEINMNEMMDLNLDSVLALYKDVKFIGIENELKHYSIHQKKEVISRIDLFIDSKNHKLRKLHYHYNKSLYGKEHFVTISFSGLEQATNFNSKTFSEANYIEKIKGKIYAKQKFKDYRLVEREIQKKRKF